MPHRRHYRKGEAGGGGGLAVPRSRTTNLSRITPAQQNNTEVLAQVGGSVTIKCYTHFLGDEMVTWLKRDEDHLLTAGIQVYSSDMRLSVAHIKHQDLWELSLRDVRLSDAGLYECQLTTHPPTSLFFTLKVVEARATIEGHPEVHFQRGHTLRLHCTVEHATEPPLYIFWFHNGSLVNYYPNKPLRILKHRYSSTLSISNVTWTHAGVYKCEPHLATPARITVHVSGEEGEKVAGSERDKKRDRGK
ncbi:obscurin-like [Cherax quadricarinatus]|uniref:obscurin-like n=1 Tax=Cherax quadricarinatus TaxID=27406 RepID=UPI00387E2617